MLESSAQLDKDKVRKTIGVSCPYKQIKVLTVLLKVLKGYLRKGGGVHQGVSVS